jgi:hypothetical protein
VLTYGLDAFTNSGGPATIERVALTDPHNLQMIAAYAVPLTGNQAYGVLEGAPPARHLPAGCTGRSGSELAARSSPRERRPIWSWCSSRSGRKEPPGLVDVFYRSAGQQYHFQTCTSLEVLVADSCPS